MCPEEFCKSLEYFSPSFCEFALKIVTLKATYRSAYRSN